MLVTFKSQSHGDVTMFGTVGKSLLKMMGQSGNVPGAIMAADLPAARQALQDKLAQVESQAPDASSGDATAQGASDGDEGEAPVSMATRALPLLEMLQSAIDADDNVMWE